MQKHFAVITGISMLAVAGIVVSQQSGGFNVSLKGQMVTTGYTGGPPISSFPTSACANPRNCVFGPAGACNPTTCQQLFNLGVCKPGTSTCATYWTGCENPSVCAPLSSSSSSTSGCPTGRILCGIAICCDAFTEQCNGSGGCMRRPPPSSSSMASCPTPSRGSRCTNALRCSSSSCVCRAANGTIVNPIGSLEGTCQ